jgi:NDP-sugar pyrophosphorylase family protein
MDAMIFAAGLGTRLRPLTDNLPKALIDINGRAAIEHVARRLIAAGATRLIINVHHHGPMIEEYIRRHDSFGVEVHFSNESELLLETGGGLLAAAPLFRRDAPFLLHNADVISDIDLEALYRQHCGRSPLATLVMMDRPTSRYLVIDQKGIFCGWGNSATGAERLAREPQGESVRLGFCGIHAISPAIFDMIEETGAFSIITLYMRLAEEGHRIETFRADGASWIDIGSPAELERARAILPSS